MLDERGALVVIDLQNDYFADGELARCRDDLVATCNALARAAHEAGVMVVDVRTVHDPQRTTWTMSMREDGQGMALRGTPGADPVVGVDLGPATVIEKTRDSAVFDTDLRRLLETDGVDHLVLAGVSTESCISATAVDAFACDLAVTLVQDATASVEWVLHDQTLQRLQAQYRQRVTTAATIIRGWRQPDRHEGQGRSSEPAGVDN